MEYKIIRTILKDGVAVVAVNPPPLNQFSEQMVTEMTDAFSALSEDSAVQAIILTGSGKQFIGGPDIREIRQIRDRENHLSRLMRHHQFVNSIESGAKPVIAAINGNCSRVGLEIAMACHYRIAAKDIRVGLLEIRFGLIPGLGGTQRLPRLTGIRAALDMITSAQDIPAEKGLHIGLIDELADEKELMNRSMDMAREFAAGRMNFRMRITGKRFDRIPNFQDRREICARFREQLREKNRGYIAPFRALETVEKGLSENFEKDIQMEAEAACDCIVSDVSKNLINIFLNARSAGYLPRIRQERPRLIRKVGILGSGVMGAGITVLLLKRGFMVRLWDINEKSLLKGVESIRHALARAVQRGELSQDMADQLIVQRLAPTVVAADFKDVDLAIEAVPENLETKQKLFRRLESICPRETVFGTTTSCLSITQIASALEISERVIGLHFLNPVENMQLLEIVISRSTSENILATGLDFARKAAKIPVVVNDGPGFFITRQLAALMSESCFIVSEGGNPFSIDKAIMDFGLPIGPAQLSDLVGMDTVLSVARCLEAALDERWKMPQLYTPLYKTGCHGRKNGAGWYDYRTEKPTLNFKYLEVVKGHLGARGISPRKIPQEEIQEQILARLINEGAYTIQDGISNRVQDMDLAMVYGTGFPPYQGGIFRYADSWGPGNVYRKLLDLEAEKGVRFRPCSLIQEMAELDRKFYEE